MFDQSSNQGYLELFIGPMFSGKTSKLVEIYNQLVFCNKKVAVINHSIDTRYDNVLLSTHDKIMIPCIQTNKLLELCVQFGYDNTDKNFTPNLNYISQVFQSEVILINEGQFFEDLYLAVEFMLKHNKKIYVCGLDGDFQRQKFGQILDLIPLCDKVTKMSSLCGLCKNGTSGIFSKRITSEKEQTIIGSNNYIPVCRIHYQSSSTVKI